MKRFGLALLTLAGVVFAGPYDTWSNYREVTVNTTSGGANVATSVSSFPLLVRLTNASTATGANVLSGSLSANGADVRFTDASGQTALSFEVERWSAGAAEFWVNVPVVAGNSTTKILMYWGKTGQVSASSGSAVFDTAAGWRAVYHMNGGTAATELDATAHGFTMSASDTVPAAVPGDTIGAVGKARMFKGDSTTIAGRQYFVAANTAGSAALNIGANNPHTISSWVYARGINSSNGSGNSIFNKGDQQYALQIYGNAGSVGVKQWEAAVYTSTWRQAKSKGPAVAGAWTHVTGTWSGGANNTNGIGKFYINGVLDSTSSLAIGAVSAQQAYNLFIGANPNGGGTNATAPGDKTALARLVGTIQRPRYWDGYIDDITLSRGARSDDYVKLTYETQKPSASAVALGATQVAGLITKLAYVDSAKAADTLVVNSGVSINIMPMLVGGPVDSFKVVGTAANIVLPPGITLNKITGALEGSSQGAFAAANRTIRAYGHFAAGDSLTRTVRISSVLGPLVLIKYSNEAASYTAGLPVTNAPVLNSGRPATKFTISAALPAGLKLDTVNGVISGTPTAATASASFTVKAINATDTSSRTIQIAVVANAETYSTWTYHRTVILNTGNGFVGPKISADVRNFPVAIRIPATDTIFRQVLAGAADLRFTKSDDVTPLAYEIEQWDSAKAATIWVLVDTVKTNSATQNIRMHWGKAGSVSRSNGSAVFSVANGFAAVWHMNGKTGNEVDVTANGFVAAAQSAPGDTTGSVGRARSFNGVSQFFQVQNSVVGPLDYTLEQNYTLSAWANPTAIATNDNGMKLVEKGDDQWTLAIYNASNPKYWEITTKINTGSAVWMQTTSEAAAVTAEGSVNKWNHIVGTYRGGAVNTPVAESLWVNGTFMATRTETPTNLTTSRTTTRPVNIGAQGTGYVGSNGTFIRFFNGGLDEVRISSVVRSADWVTLEYANQQSATAQTFAIFTNPTGVIGNNGSALSNSLGLNVKSSVNGILFSLQGANTGDKAVLSLVDMWGRTVFKGSFGNGGNLVWNGTANNGQGVSTGIYIARVTVLDAQNKLRKVMDHKVPFTR